jgi:hypothetical protein
MDDRERHGRTQRGEKHHNAKLTAEQVVAIREFVASGHSCVEAGERFGTSPDNALDIAKGVWWRHVGGPILEHVPFIPPTRGERNPKAKLTDALVIAMRERFAAGESAANLHQEFAISLPVIFKICHGQAWRHVGGPISPHGRRSHHQ